MADVRYYDAEPEHVDAVLAELRPQDFHELVAAAGPGVRELMQRGLRMSDEAKVAIDEYGRVLCVFGVCRQSMLSDIASPWLIGTTHLERYTSTLTRVGREYVGRWIKEYKTLINHVDARNRWSVVWLKRIGFAMDKPQPFGVAGLPFHRFHMEQASV